MRIIGEKEADNIMFWSAVVSFIIGFLMGFVIAWEIL